MQQTARLALGARRWQPYLKTFEFVGVDLTDAVLQMQVRLYPNAPHAPLVNLTTVDNGNAEGLRLVAVEVIDGQTVSIVSVKINEATIEGLPFAGEAGDDSVLAWDMQVDPAGGYKQVWAEGEFWVLSAVTGAGTVPQGVAPGGGSSRQRPSFSTGTIPFQIGDTVVRMSLGPGVGRQGEPGQDAAPAARVDFIATQGQTTFPAAGSLEELDPPFHWDESGVVKVNGDEISPITPDYMVIEVNGGKAIQLAEGLDAGETVALHAFQLTGMENGSILKRASFSIGKSAYQKLTEIIALDDADAATDDEALAQLLADGYRRIRLLAGRGGGESGEYLFNADPWIVPPVGNDFSGAVEAPSNLVSGLELIGDGMGADPATNTHVRCSGDGYIFLFDSLSEDPADNGEDITLRRMRLIGEADTLPHAEHRHLVALHGVTRPTFEEVAFIAGQGDGVDVLMGRRNDTVRYNRAFRAHRCHFDGLVNNGRNCISLEAISGASITDSYFARWGTTTHPGPITIEPIDRPEYEARDIIVSGNVFEDYNGGAVTLNLSRPTIYTVPSGIVRVFANTMRDGRTGIDAYGGWYRGDDLDTLVRHRVQVFANISERVTYPVRTEGMAGMDIYRNEFTDFETILIGNDNSFAGQNFVNVGVRIDENTFVRGGSLGVTVTQANDTIACSLSRNTYIDCGDQDALTPNSYGFLARRGEIGIKVLDNEVQEPIEPRIAAFAVVSDENLPIGPTAQKSGNSFPDGAPPIADTFKPTRQPRGVYGGEALTAAETIQPGQSTFHDITVQGAVQGQKFSVFLDRFLGPTDILVTDGFSRDVNVVRAAFFNAGTSAITLPLGTYFTVAEIL